MLYPVEVIAGPSSGKITEFLAGQGSIFADLFMLYPVEVVAGLSSRKIMDSLAEEGSNVNEFFMRTSV